MKLKLFVSKPGIGEKPCESGAGDDRLGDDQRDDDPGDDDDGEHTRLD